MRGKYLSKIETIALLLYGGVKPKTLQRCYGITEEEIKEAKKLLTRTDEMCHLDDIKG